MIVAIRDKDFVVPTDDNTIGQPKFARPPAGLPKAKQQPAPLVENLDVVEQCIDHVNMAKGINGHTLRTAEVAGAVAQASELSFELAVLIQHLNAIIHRIRYQEISSAIRREVSWEIELPFASAPPAKFGLKSSLAIKNDNAMALGVGDEELVPK